ncbi:MAG: hypothetical protein WAU23_09260 [Ferruginibacter sp.]
MNIDIKNKNLVLIGQFNPLQFDKYFFIKNEFFSEEEISDKSIFSEFQVHLFSKHFAMLIHLDRIQISDLSPDYDGENELPDFACKLLSLVNNSFPLIAIGINFQWFVHDGNKSIENLSKEVFYSKDISIFEKYFNTEDVAFGTYVSKKIKDARLKLEVKPIVAMNIKNKTGETLLNWLFNFHIDLPENCDQTQVNSYIKDFDYYKNESLQIISTIKS